MWKYFSCRIHLYNCTIPITLSTYLYLYLYIPLSRGNSLLSCWASLTNTLPLCIRDIKDTYHPEPIVLAGPRQGCGEPELFGCARCLAKATPTERLWAATPNLILVQTTSQKQGGSSEAEKTYTKILEFPCY